jgi:hypothetical protein
VTLGQQKMWRTTVRIVHSWHAAYESALKESDPGELIGRLEYAISAIERRSSEWEANPGSPAELKAIQQCISALKRLMKREQARRHGAVFANVSEAQAPPCSASPRMSEAAY